MSGAVVGEIKARAVILKDHGHGSATESPFSRRSFWNKPFFITDFSVSIKEKVKTKTAVSDAEVGEMEAQAVILMIMHRQGASTVQANFLNKDSSWCYRYKVSINFVCLPRLWNCTISCSVFTMIGRRIELYSTRMPGNGLMFKKNLTGYFSYVLTFLKWKKYCFLRKFTLYPQDRNISTVPTIPYPVYRSQYQYVSTVTATVTHPVLWYRTTVVRHTVQVQEILQLEQRNI